MWERKRLILSELADGVMCSVLAVHPWTVGAGHKEASGVYLSPANAVNWAIKKMASAPSVWDVTAIMVTAPTLTAFIAALAKLIAVFPLPAVSALYRRAQTAETLAVSRMQIPALSGGLPPVSALSVASLRRASSANELLNAANIGGVDLDAALSAFKAVRQTLIASAQDDYEGITGAALEVYALSSEGNIASAIKGMRDDIPNADHVFALCLVFAGEDLSAIRGMLHHESG